MRISDWSSDVCSSDLGALPMLIAFTVDPWYAVWALGFVVIYQQFENYVLQPKLTAKTVDIHPAVAFGSVIAGTALLGAVGALRSEERRVGNECVSTLSSRWSPSN